MGYYDHVPDTPKAKQGGAKTGDGGDGGKPPPVDPNAPAPGGYDMGPVHFGFTNRGTPGVSWLGIPGWLPSSQRIHNVIDRTTNNMSLNTADPITSAVGGGDLPSLRLQRAQMHQQMPIGDKAAADALGQFNPTLALRLIPGFSAVGGMAQGAVQEGVKGYAQGESWPKIARDAVVGAGAGGITAGVTAPEALGPSVGYGVTTGIPGGLGYLYGDKDKDPFRGVGGPLGGAVAGKVLLDPLNNFIQRSVANAPSWATAPARIAPDAALAGASYWNQQQRDRDTLSGR